MLSYFFNEIIEYDMNEEPARFKKNRIIDKIRYPLIYTALNTELANVVHEV